MLQTARIPIRHNQHRSMKAGRDLLMSQQRGESRAAARNQHCEPERIIDSADARQHVAPFHASA
jgi:hypothetical protein